MSQQRKVRKIKYDIGKELCKNKKNNNKKRISQLKLHFIGVRDI